MFLAGSLGESWFWVLEVMQNAEYVITAKGSAVGGAGGGGGGGGSTGMGRSASKPGSRVVSMIGSPQLSGGPGSGGGQPKHPLLADLDGENLHIAIQRLFEVTTKTLEDEAFGDFVRALCKLSWEMIGMQSSGVPLSRSVNASSATLAVSAGAPAGVTESLESLSLSPGAEAPHRRRVSGIHISRSLRTGDFGISKLLTVSLLNIHRLIYRSPSIAWEPTTSHLLSVIRDENVKDKEKLGAPQGVRIQAAKALDELLVVSLKNLGSGIGMGEKKSEVQRQVLDVLGKQVILISSPSETGIGGGSGGSTMVEVELRKMGLQTLHEILQNSAHTLVVGWERIFEMLGSVCLPSASQQSGGTSSVPSSPLLSRWKSNTNSPAIGQGHPSSHSERGSASLVKIAFQSLTLVCDSVATLEPDHLRLCIITLGQFGRQPDTNIALTAATSLLWAVSDAIQSKRKTLKDATTTTDVPTMYKTYSDLWLFLLGEILGLCIGIGDERREVRDGAIQTLFRALMFYGGTLSLGEWEECVWGILVPLFEKLGATTVSHHDHDHEDSSLASAPTSPTLTTTSIALSLGGDRQQDHGWDDSKILAFHSIGSIFHDFLASRLIHLESFAKVWDFLVSRVQDAVLYDSRPISSPALRALEKAIKAAGLAVGSPADAEDATSLKDKIVEACERAWKAFEDIGDLVLKKQTEPPQSPRSSSGGFSSNVKRQAFTQESLVSFVDVIQRTREVERSILAREWDLQRLERLMAILKGILTYPSSPDYRPDIDSLSPVQAAVLDTVNGIDLSAAGVSSLVIRDISEYATLAFMSGFDVQAAPHSQAPPKRVSYIALAKKAMPLLVDLFLQFKGVADIYSDGTIESMILAYAIPIKMKYDCPAPSKFGKDSPLWKTATTNFLRVVKECLPQLNVLREGISHERVEGIWRQIVDVFRGAIIADCSIAAETFTLEEQEVEENFDLALIASLEIDLLPHLGDARVPDDTICQLSKVLHQGSLLYDASAGDSRSSSPITDSLRQARDFGMGGVPEGSYGSTDQGSPRPRERFSYWCLDLLFLMCSDFCKDQEPLRKRVAALSLSSLLDRCHSTLASYVADEMIRGGLPFPRAREEELLYIIRKLLDLSLWPGSLWAAFSDDPSKFSNDQPVIDTSLSPAALVADAVKRSSVAHLFHLYSILCEIGSLPRKPPTTWVSSPKGQRTPVPPPRTTVPIPPQRQPSTGTPVEMDARSLARECLRTIGRELGVSR
ncbi:hypothetical protein ONZ45_g2894 [Pleurotus djamor]|nr:hypothetical protein ONZ45_g2894 [Pleurotus djamor]